MNVKKGDLIKFSITDNISDQKQYSVIKVVSETVFEVSAMYLLDDVQYFNKSTSTYYQNSILDTYLNSTWYSSLSSITKEAIVAKNIAGYRYDNSINNQTSTRNSTSAYPGYAYGGYFDRNVYVLDIQDVEIYFGGSTSSKGSYTANDLTSTFLNSSSSKCEWLRSSYRSLSDGSDIFCLNGGYIG